MENNSIDDGLQPVEEMKISDFGTYVVYLDGKKIPNMRGGHLKFLAEQKPNRVKAKMSTETGFIDR